MEKIEVEDRLAASFISMFGAIGAFLIIFFNDRTAKILYFAPIVLAVYAAANFAVVVHKSVR